MLNYDSIEVSERINISKTNAWKEQPYEYNGCHDLKIHSVDYCCIITGITKSEGINLMQNIDLI